MLSGRIRMLACFTTATAVAALSACSSDDPTPTSTPSTAPSTALTSSASPVSGLSSDAGPTPKAAPATAGTPDPQATAPSDGSQKAVLNSLPGRAKPGGKCVKVEDQGDIRSGRLAVGNFANAKSFYEQNQGQTEVPLYVIPARTSAKQAVVRLAPADGSGEVRKVSTSAKQKADTWTYFAVQVPVPAAGAYRLTATSGGATACFDVTFG